jgi:hypothetical protein
LSKSIGFSIKTKTRGKQSLTLWEETSGMS